MNKKTFQATPQPVQAVNTRDTLALQRERERERERERQREISREKAIRHTVGRSSDKVRYHEEEDGLIKIDKPSRRRRNKRRRGKIIIRRRTTRRRRTKRRR